jgi:hypothetical protein
VPRLTIEDTSILLIRILENGKLKSVLLEVQMQISLPLKQDLRQNKKMMIP